MISFSVYKALHFLGVFILVTSLVASLARSAQGGRKPDPWRKRLAAAHGVALVLVLVGGFGMLARLGLPITGWVGAKLAIWIAAAALIALRKNPRAAGWGVALVPLLAALAGLLASMKPF